MRASAIQVANGTLETGWWGPDPAEAPTLVLLHEGLGSVRLWRDVPERLADATGWGVFAYSRFGYGESDRALLPRPVNYLHHEAQAVLPEVLRAAGIRRMAMIGHSDGGSIAAIYAGDNRHDADPKLLSLIMIAAHFVVEDLNIESIRKIKVEYETGTLKSRLARHHRDVEIAFRGWNDVWLDPRFRDFDITGFLPSIQVPILALQGADDPYGTELQLDVLRANIRTPLQTAMIPDAKHSPHLEAKDETLATITAFICNLQRGFQP